MSEKIYARLLRLYPWRFRKEYEGEALQLIRDRLRDEKGFFKKVRLWWDLVSDVLAGLPSAYRNSYAVTEAASLSLKTAGIPAFESLDEEPLGRGSILLAGTLSLIGLAAFAFLLTLPITYQPLPGSNKRLSPIEAVMKNLDQAEAPDSAASRLPDAAPAASAQMNAPQAQPAGPVASSQDTPAPSSATAIPSGDGNQVVSMQMQSVNNRAVLSRNGPNAAKAPPIATARHRGDDARSLAKSAPKLAGQPGNASHAMILSLPAHDIADTWQGTLHAGGKDVRTVIKITKANSGGYKAALYSIDQGPKPAPVTTITLEGSTVRYRIKAFDLTYEGTLSADGRTIVGRSSQGWNSQPLTLTRSMPETAWQIPSAGAGKQ